MSYLTRSVFVAAASAAAVGLREATVAISVGAEENK